LLLLLVLLLVLSIPVLVQASCTLGQLNVWHKGGKQMAGGKHYYR
jgi:hypothetical protein